MDIRRRKWLECLRSECVDEPPRKLQRESSRGFSGGEPTHVDGTGEVPVQDIESMDQKREDVGSTIISRLVQTEFKSSRRYISDVIACPSDAIMERVWAHLQEYGNRQRYRASGGPIFFLICKEKEDGHIHVVHDCAYSNKACRCSWKDHQDIRGGLQRYLRRARYINELQQQDWENVLLYFVYQKYKGEEHAQIWIRGELQRFPPGSEIIRWRNMCSERAKLLGESKQDPRVIDNIRRGIGIAPPFEQAVPGSHKQFKKARSRYEKIRDQVEELLKYNPCYPIDNIKKCEEFIKNDFLMEYKNRFDIEQALTAYKIKICNIKLKDLYNLYHVPGCNPLFSCGYKEFSETYYELDRSTEILNELLLFQFDEDAEIVANFLQTLKAIVDREIPKLNTLILYGPPSSGKNYFIDTLLNVCMNVAQFGSIINRHNRFAYQEAENRRLIYWNEPNYESAELEQLKTICGGDNYTVQVKCKGDASIWGTPVIVTTNNRLSIMTDKAFQDRVRSYTWKTAKFLKDYHLKPNPLAFFEILKLYNLFD